MAKCRFKRNKLSDVARFLNTTCDKIYHTRWRMRIGDGHVKTDTKLFYRILVNFDLETFKPLLDDNNFIDGGFKMKDEILQEYSNELKVKYDKMQRKQERAKNAKAY